MGPSRPPVRSTTPSEWWGRYVGSSLGFLRLAALARVKRREMLEYPSRVWASRVRREPSVRVSSPPVMGRMPRSLASRANSRAPHRLVSVRAKGGIARGPWLWPVARGRETLPARRNKNSWRGALRIPPSSGRLPVPTGRSSRHGTGSYACRRRGPPGSRSG